MVLPFGILGGTMSHDNPWAPLTMTGVALPAYATPMVAMSQLGSMFQHGNSVGAAFILLCFGAGMNLGLLAWMWWHYGWKKLGIWFGIMLLIVIGISYGVEGPLYPKAIEHRTIAMHSTGTVRPIVLALCQQGVSQQILFDA
jgi:hypothetical protein